MAYGSVVAVYDGYATGYGSYESVVSSGELAAVLSASAVYDSVVKVYKYVVSWASGSLGTVSA